MTDIEIEIVAAELAKAGGTSWYPGPRNEPLLRVVTDRYRDRARLAIETLEHHRAKAKDSKAALPNDDAGSVEAPVELIAGSLVMYRPPGDRRSYRCTIAYMDDARAYLVPEDGPARGWVDISDLATGGRVVPLPGV